ncbi:hypothetical protein HHI36_004361 [Cryptolaemus montrouzieri]|uniref:Transcriptional regulator MraZ n=1 Tax=Cryptolaemus montrouzieri TaxID=559131 RepID=A0ABD2NS04_9CUCU
MPGINTVNKIETLIGGKRYSEVWKFIRSLKSSNKDKVHISSNPKNGRIILPTYFRKKQSIEKNPQKRIGFEELEAKGTQMGVELDNDCVYTLQFADDQVIRKLKSSLLYGSEIWRLTERFKSRLKAVEMDVLRRSSRTSRREHVPNEVIKREMGVEDNITKDIERKQLVWYGT